MTVIDQKIADLARAIEKLPQAAQADVLAELEARIDGLTIPQMTDAQRAIVSSRMSAARDYTSPGEVDALLRRLT